MAGIEAGAATPRRAGSLRESAAWPIAALTFNAFVWGVSWWPLRALQDRGLHPLWATAVIYALAVLVISCVRPRAWRELFAVPALWVLVLASGTTNAAFNWAVTIGDVVRVVLLFYVMPLWALLLARWLLSEPFTRFVLLRAALALGGALVMLAPAGNALPLPRSLAEWLGMVGGFGFALNNVMLRREAARSEAARALAMFSGGTVVAAAIGTLLAFSGTAAWPPPPRWDWLAGALALGALFLLSNLALQFGAARLSANATAVVMLTEIVFASGSAVWLGAGELTARTAVGGALIVAAALLAARPQRATVLPAASPAPR
jgi:drug/metabolite transporter (DMT)-like permease